MTCKLQPEILSRPGSTVSTQAVNLAVWSALILTLAFVPPALHAQKYQVIHRFTAAVDGSGPNALTRDAAGNFFGTAKAGGSSANYGTVFKLDAITQALTVLHTFTGTPDGGTPHGRLILDAAGNLYGTTQVGGSGNLGTVFKVDSSGVESILYSFHQGDGHYPMAGLTPGFGGNLYGTTSAGGTADDGVVFQITTSGREKTLHEFTGTDGATPIARLTRDSAGNLYGTTSARGQGHMGTAFKLAPDGTETILHSFTGGADGGTPAAELLLDSAGNLYGTAEYGGDFLSGTVFKIDTAGNFSVLHSFTGNDGAAPQAGLVQDSAGNLYGTTSLFGETTHGTVFELDPSGNETVLHKFTVATDGKTPTATMVLLKDGTLYGTTDTGGGSIPAGIIFRLKP